MAMIESSIVCDSGPIIHLDELNCLRLLRDFKAAFLPDAVWKEVSFHRSSALEKSGVVFERCAGKIPSDEQLLTMCRIYSLDAGETEALALMEKSPQSIFLTDDASARLVGQQMGFRVHGTIGVLVRSLRREQMKPEQVVDLLSQIPLKSSLYIKRSLLNEIVLRIREEYHI
ncbi:MAG: DNA-binding protein [bacterium]